jgi:putative transcriptional regulator
MMKSARHPAPDELLLDYAVGATSPGKALLVATHLAMCDESRRRFGMLVEIGGAVLASLDGMQLERATAEEVVARASATSIAAGTRPRPAMRSFEATPATGGFPPPLAALLADDQALRWRHLGLGVQAAELAVSTPEAKTQLLRARPGVRIMEHTHIGEEAVLIVKGAFIDRGQRYEAGDVAISDDGTIHAPQIDEAEECLCLAVTEGPIRFVGRHGWLLNMVNRF